MYNFLLIYTALAMVAIAAILPLKGTEIAGFFVWWWHEKVDSEVDYFKGYNRDDWIDYTVGQMKLVSDQLTELDGWQYIDYKDIQAMRQKLLSAGTLQSCMDIKIPVDTKFNSLL